MSKEENMFAKSLTTTQIKNKIKKLTKHKVIQEIDLLLGELRRRKKQRER